MTRGGWPIETYHVKNAVNPNIDYSLDFATYDAIVATGLDLWKYEQGEYDDWFLNRIIAFHRLRNQINLNTQDAVNRKTEQKRKQASKKKGR